MKVEKYLQGENPLQDDGASIGSLPRYAIFFMIVIAAGTLAQYGIGKIANFTNAQEVQNAVPEV